VRVGRVVLPAFLISDYQNVGYANTMMRPPIEMYARHRSKPDGADINYQHAFGDLNFTTRPSPASAAASCSYRPPLLPPTAPHRPA
jgi:hypothetical protein